MPKRRWDVGSTEPQAEGQGSALANALEGSTAECATKAAIADVRSDLKALKSRLDAWLEAMKVEWLKWVMGLFIAQIGIFAALVKLLP